MIEVCEVYAMVLVLILIWLSTGNLFYTKHQKFGCPNSVQN